MHKTNITLHGDLGENIGKQWSLCVNSVGEAMRAIEVLSKRKLYKYLLEKDKQGIKYRVLINGRDFISEKPVNIEEIDTIKNSELMITFKEDSLKTIDIIPILEGSGSNFLGILGIILGVILIVIGLFGQPYLIVAGIALLAGGVISLLTSPPKFDNYKDIQKSKASYLFNGPYNTTEEGGPVPVGYGRLIVGSQTISSTYDIYYTQSSENSLLYRYTGGDLDVEFGSGSITILSYTYIVKSNSENSTANTATLI